MYALSLFKIARFLPVVRLTKRTFAEEYLKEIPAAHNPLQTLSFLCFSVNSRVPYWLIVPY